jgi:hypothetical protein
MKRHSKRKSNNLKPLALAISLSLLSACGGGGGDNSTGGGDGGIIGTAKIPTITSLSPVEAKSKTGKRQTANVAADGSFRLKHINNETYLLRTKPKTSARTASRGSDTRYLYSIGHSNGTSTITRNIHPFTDLIVRNWFATKGLDINNEFEKGGAIAQLPSVSEINAIEKEIEGVISQILKDYGVISNNNNTIDLLSTPFTINGQGFDNFLNKNPVVINNNQITLIFNQPNGGTQSISINGLPLDNDFTSNNDTPPTSPTQLRALPASTSEIVVVWEASTDDKGVAGYNIFRNGNLIGTSPFPVFSDTGLSTNTNYSYTVEAIDSRGQKSTLTSATTPLVLNTPDTTAPVAATGLTATAAGNDITLNWTQSQIDDVSSFRILRGAPGNANTQIAQITSTAFTDFNLPGSSTAYCYRIISVDAAGNQSPKSNESCANISGSGGAGSQLAFSSSSYQVTENATSITITVNRMGQLGQPVTVHYATSAGSATSGTDFTASSGTLNWAANDTAPKTFTIQIAADNIAEGNETVILTLSSPSGASIATSTATLTIKDAATTAQCVDLQNTSITQDTTLSLPCYNIKKDMYVEGASTLTIKPGVMLKFAAGKELRIRSDGAMNAVGTASAPIIFTGAQQTPGYWDGIIYYNSNNTKNELKYATVEYGGGGGSSGDANLEIATTSRIKISHTTLRQSGGYGVLFSTDAIIDLFSNNTLTGNEGTPVRIPANKIGKLDSQSRYSGNASNREYISVFQNSDVFNDQTWQALDVPYKLHNNSVEAVLTIKPGTTLIFRQGGNFRIESNGTLIARGTAAKNITFTGENKTPGSWHGLQFTFSGTANELDHVNVEYAGGTNGNGYGAVTLFSTPGRLKMHNTTISDSLQYGLAIDNPKHIIDMSNVTFINNEKGSVLVDADIVGKLDKNSTYNAPIVWDNQSEIKTDQTIPNLGAPYIVGKHNIRASAIIEAGSTLIFRAGGGFRIDSGTGSLTAIGTSDAPITFTGKQQVPGYWKGIEFFTKSVSNRLDNTIVEYAGAPGGNTEGLVGVFFRDSVVDVTNSILRHSATNGLWLYDNSTGTHSNNSFSDIAGENIFIDNP